MPLPRIYLSPPDIGSAEIEHVLEAFQSNWIAPAGPNLDAFEEDFAVIVGSKHAVAVSSGTAALHLALRLAGVGPGDEVLCSSLTFIASAAPITYLGAKPVFIDSEEQSWNMDPALACAVIEQKAKAGKTPKALVLVHLYGPSADITPIKAWCDKHGVKLIEDAAEALGATYGEASPGSFGLAGIHSFNGNKIITTGGGGMLLTDDPKIAAFARHVSTTAKQPHAWEFFHDMVGYNYRLSNVGAALGCAQMENLNRILASKRELANQYREFFRDKPVSFIDQPSDSSSNFWLNAIILRDRAQRDILLSTAHESGVMVRPIWTLMSKLPMYHSCQHDSLANAEWLEDRVVNLPSSSRL